MLCKCYSYDKHAHSGVCFGTKNCEICSCDGQQINCDFYETVREKGRKSNVHLALKSNIDELLSSLQKAQEATDLQQQKGQLEECLSLVKEMKIGLEEN